MTHNREKYPEIFAAMMVERDELDKLKAKRKKHTDAMKPIRAEMDALNKQLEGLNLKAMEDYDRIRELAIAIGQKAEAMGAVKLSAEPING